MYPVVGRESGPQHSVAANLAMRPALGSVVCSHQPLAHELRQKIPIDRRWLGAESSIDVLVGAMVNVLVGATVRQGKRAGGASALKRKPCSVVKHTTVKACGAMSQGRRTRGTVAPQRPSLAGSDAAQRPSPTDK